MSTKKDESKDSERESELKKLIKEKIELSRKLGIMGTYQPVENFKETDEYKRINEIDIRLWDLVK
ncbi:hypothetical protein P4H66_19445 [Paenibacillus dokdonensis]|uniref:Uncharacterized protein n=1 Tax=Paenibacillus dokdonensis TaxID=2567944 RepID=A0ABU6GQE5_9BACL|nr:hypothetical protein [Paenibacillus dokdonensis]MEC0241981.1 hypothetical protein [Paenibacillus dokdonensis]